MDYKVDKETAKEELQRWFDAWRMEFDEDEFSSEEREDFDSRIKDLIFAIRRGKLIFDDETNEIEYILKTAIKSTNEITKVNISIPKGSDVLEMDNYKAGQDMKKSFSIVASLIKKPLSIVSKMDERDIHFILGINTLFLAS